MLTVVRYLLLVLACALFLCACFNWELGPITRAFIPGGLFCWCLSTLLGTPTPKITA